MDGSIAAPQAVAGNHKDRLLFGDRPECLAFVGDDASEVCLRSGLSQMVGRLHTRRGNVQLALRTLEREPTPQVLLVDVSGVAEPLRELAMLASVCSPDVRVLVIGDREDIGFYRALTHDLGVMEYIAKPLTGDLVSRLFGPCFAGEDTSSDADARGQGQIIAVYGARGGCGATTIAVNLALQLAEVGRGHISLLDLHLRGGTAGLMLGVCPGTGLRVALEEPDRVDGLMLERVSILVEDRLRLIAADEPMESMPQPNEAGMQRVLELLRLRSNYVIVDMPVPPGPAERAVLAKCRQCIIVTGPDVAGIRDTLAIRQMIASVGDARATVVLNRFNQPGALRLKLVEEGLGAPPSVQIPDLSHKLLRAAHLGRPAVRDSAAFQRALAPLLQEVASMPMTLTSSSLLDRVFARFGL